MDLHVEEKILKKYKNEYETVDEDDSQQNLGLTENMEFEFSKAFALMADGNDTIPKEQIKDVFAMIGLTFQSWDIERMLVGSITDSQGKYSFDVILEAFEFWIQGQLSLEDLYSAFCMLRKHHKILSDYELDAKSKKRMYGKEKKFDMNRVSGEVLCEHKDETVTIFEGLLNEILCTDAGNRLTREEIRDVILEISSSEKELIKFEDFVRIFTS